MTYKNGHDLTVCDETKGLLCKCPLVRFWSPFTAVNCWPWTRHSVTGRPSSRHSVIGRPSSRHSVIGRPSLLTEFFGHTKLFFPSLPSTICLQNPTVTNINGTRGDNKSTTTPLTSKTAYWKHLEPEREKRERVSDKHPLLLENWELDVIMKGSAIIVLVFCAALAMTASGKTRPTSIVCVCRPKFKEFLYMLIGVANFSKATSFLIGSVFRLEAIRKKTKTKILNYEQK